MSLDVYLMETRKVSIYDGNITSNLGPMADAAGLFEVLWYPKEFDIYKAEQLIPHLKLGLKKLKTNPAKYSNLNPENGWGSYDVLVKFVSNYLAACEENPNAEISVSR